MLLFLLFRNEKDVAEDIYICTRIYMEHHMPVCETLTIGEAERTKLEAFEEGVPNKTI